MLQALELDTLKSLEYEILKSFNLFIHFLDVWKNIANLASFLRKSVHLKHGSEYTEIKTNQKTPQKPQNHSEC